MNTMKSYLLPLVCFLSFSTVFNAAELPAPQAAAVKKRLLPTPKQVILSDGLEIVLDDTLTLNVELAEEDSQAKTLAGAIFKRQFSTSPNIIVSKKDDVPKEADAYRIRAAGKTVTLSASGFRGIRNALSTLRQLAEVNRDGIKLVSYRIPETEIDDAPAMTFRGLHLCWFPETRYARIEQAVRLAAYYKFNHVVIEFWGTFPSKKHPKLCLQEFAAKPEEIQRLVALGKELGVTLIPQFNLFGHASGARSISLKHISLDRYPEYQPIYEPDGWNWCISNPGTREVLTDIVLEMLDAFENPPFFHIGLDEALPPECRNCLRSDYKQLFFEHLLYFHQLLSDRKCRMMMWHDMLISGNDARWRGYVAHANQYTDGITEKLPRDVIICDWQYGSGKEKEETWPTMRYFKELGFTVLACPWTNTPGMRSQGQTVADAELDGMLCTTWHHLYGEDMYKIFSMGGQVTWCEPPNYPGVYHNVFGTHLRQIGWDMPVKDFQDTGHVDFQISPKTVPQW